MARGDAIARGTAAKRILDDPIYQHAFEACERDIVNALAAIPMTGADDCDALIKEKVHDLQSMRRHRAKLVEYMEHGKIEDRRLEAVVNQQPPVKDPRWR